jgi:hypothetical protein
MRREIKRDVSRNSSQRRQLKRRRRKIVFFSRKDGMKRCVWAWRVGKRLFFPKWNGCLANQFLCMSKRKFYAKKRKFYVELYAEFYAELYAKFYAKLYAKLYANFYAKKLMKMVLEFYFRVFEASSAGLKQSGEFSCAKTSGYNFAESRKAASDTWSRNWRICWPLIFASSVNFSASAKKAIFPYRLKVFIFSVLWHVWTSVSFQHFWASFKVRVARWFIFKPQIHIWVKFGGPRSGKCYTLWPFEILFAPLV